MTHQKVSIFVILSTWGNHTLFILSDPLRTQAGEPQYKTMDNLPARVLLSLAMLKPIPYLLDAIEIKQEVQEWIMT